jgi:hypothetical protein
VPPIDTCGEYPIRVSAAASCLWLTAERTAHQFGVPRRALHLKLLMHLPRVANPTGEIGTRQVESEASRLAASIPPLPEWGCGESRGAGVESLRFGELDEGTAREIWERFHYIGSHRDNSRHYGLWTDADSFRPVAAASVSENDADLLLELAAHQGLDASNSLVVSRVFAFPVAPRNTVSHLLGCCARAERRMGAQLLLTYVNPNLGFTGTSYRASNWTELAREPVKGYAYVDRTYVTARQLESRFGSHDGSELRRTLGNRFEESTMRLEPLMVFGLRH